MSITTDPMEHLHGFQTVPQERLEQVLADDCSYEVGKNYKAKKKKKNKQENIQIFIINPSTF